NFHYIQNNLVEILSLQEKPLTHTIFQAVKIKAKIVCADEKEAGQRMILNFGHTIGHALENLSAYKMLHGYAVGYGILVEAKMAVLMGFLREQDYQTIQTLFAALGIKPQALKKYDSKKIIAATQTDKKAKAGKVRYVLLKKIGAIQVEENHYAHPVPEKIVQ